MAKAAAQTGSSPTMIVAIEQYFPEEKRIIKDDLAYRILPSSMKGMCLSCKEVYHPAKLI